MFAYSLNLIGLILNELNLESNLMNKNIQIVNNYMEKKNISQGLQYQIRLAFEPAPRPRTAPACPRTATARNRELPAPPPSLPADTGSTSSFRGE